MLNPFRRARLVGLSRVERLLCVAGVALLATAWPTAGTAWVSNTLTGLGIATLGLVVARLAKQRKARNIPPQQAQDRAVAVYPTRSRYNELLEHVAGADHVDVMGMSLAYAMDFLRDHAREFFRRVETVRVLLPGSREICEERDRAQSGAPGTLWQHNVGQLATARQLQRDYPNSIEIRFFTLQPYCAMTRIDETIWAAPYVAKGGASSMLIEIDRDSSPHGFDLYSSHFERIWNDPGTKRWPDAGIEPAPGLHTSRQAA